ncbi:MAG TPA: porphobilinogen synthase, partial [Fimbriiglobus sp.]
MTATFPIVRPRRLRATSILRSLVRETELNPRDFVLPLFVRPGKGIRQEIASMPGNYQLSVDTLIDEIGSAKELGITSFLFFGIPTHKDPKGLVALEDDGIVQQALRAAKKAFQHDVLLITDECFCEY